MPRKKEELPEYRQKGLKLLSTKIKPLSKTKKVEKDVSDSSSNQEEYFQQIYDYLGQLHLNPKEEFKPNKWEYSSFDKCRKKEDHELNLLSEDIKMEKGEFPCKFCGCRECFIYQMQTRSIDEGATTYGLCTKCKRRFRP